MCSCTTGSCQNADKVLNIYIYTRVHISLLFQVRQMLVLDRTKQIGLKSKNASCCETSVTRVLHFREKRTGQSVPMRGVLPATYVTPTPTLIPTLPLPLTQTVTPFVFL